MTSALRDLTPRKIVAHLDRYIVGQEAAKKCVAIAMRNRYRRRMLSPEMAEEIAPKNIIMIGPTGVGKTEIARRLASLTSAPFLKIEATKFTEVGYVGRDIESMIRDLTEIGIQIVRNERKDKVRDRIKDIVEERVLSLVASAEAKGFYSQPRDFETPQPKPIPAERSERLRMLRAGELDHLEVEATMESSGVPKIEVMSGSGMEEMGINFGSMLGSLFPSKKRTIRTTVREAVKALEGEEANKLLDQEEINAEALRRVQNEGIVFLDEIDKIVGTGSRTGPEVSREGVQRDLLPIVEGTTVTTKYGPVRTNHILFISAGAFSLTKPSDLIPELQGRFPIRVELSRLTEADFVSILTKPRNALVSQYRELLGADGVVLEVSEGAISRIASYAVKVNSAHEDIGARRLHTIMEKLLEEILFDAPYQGVGETKIAIDEKTVDDRLAELVRDQDLARYIL